VSEPRYELRPIGRVESSLKERSDAPNQGDEGAPEAWIVFDAAVLPGLRELEPGTEVLLFTWFDRASRDVLRVRPRGDPSRPERGVFGTRSPDRPNPIGIHRVRVLEIDLPRLRVAQLEALDGTPIVDVKPILEPLGER